MLHEHQRRHDAQKAEGEIRPPRTGGIEQAHDDHLESTGSAAEPLK
jgi:hypothetical protein